MTKTVKNFHPSETKDIHAKDSNTQADALQRVTDAVRNKDVEIVHAHLTGMAKASDGSGRMAQTYFHEVAFNHPPEHS